MPPSFPDQIRSADPCSVFSCQVSRMSAIEGGYPIASGAQYTDERGTSDRDLEPWNGIVRRKFSLTEAFVTSRMKQAKLSSALPLD